AVPVLRVLDVEDGVQRKVAPLLAAEADALERLRGAGRAARRSQLDRAERAHAVPGVAAGAGHRGHGVRQREALPDGVLDRRLEIERIDEAAEHRAVHAFLLPSPLLVPVVA